MDRLLRYAAVAEAAAFPPSRSVELQYGWARCREESVRTETRYLSRAPEAPWKALKQFLAAGVTVLRTLPYPAWNPWRSRGWNRPLTGRFFPVGLTWAQALNAAGSGREGMDVLVRWFQSG